MAKHTHVVITFTQGGQLRFVDPRTFGEMFVTEVDNVEKQVTELAHLGIDPLETAMSWEHFGSLLAQRHAKLKPLLMDQKFIAGIGNIYSDEILWGAGLRWDRMSDALTAQEVRRLYRSMMETLQEAVKHRGSSLADEQYVDLFGRPGEYQQFHNVYAREGAGVPALPPRRRARALRRPLHLLLRRVPGLSRASSRRSTIVRSKRACFGSAGGCKGSGSAESCHEQAVALGVTGWVRNLTDGRVEAVFEGPEAAVDRVGAVVPRRPSPRPRRRGRGAGRGADRGVRLPRPLTSTASRSACWCAGASAAERQIAVATLRPQPAEGEPHACS